MSARLDTLIALSRDRGATHAERALAATHADWHESRVPTLDEWRDRSGYSSVTPIDTTRG
jgi:hypothetical protein